ncbi:tumor suppressor, Mitostatin-domain-containing protein [Tribonema minus]|uniref:Cilia- and flagella-associated protein 45 n=1 Tax=Tribonema minus TaxID=303371 RepID=A0A835YY84_9STRA|nr:tumor suppressor, Mitostatin-domain-containing protein [Tribonema minus]
MVSDTRSEASRGSGTRRYRVVSRGSEVDEALFGGASKGSKGSPAKHTTQAQKVAKPAPNTTMLSTKELHSIREHAIIKSNSEEQAERERLERENDQRQQAARARKQRMIQMADEAKAKAKRSDLELETIAREQLVRKMANEKLDENNDLVKMLNSLGSRAAAFTIRDQQLADRASKESTEKEYDTRMDKVMELDRLKSLQARDEVEQAKLRKRHEDRKVIMEQIETRQRAKLLELEAREQESQAMRLTAKRYEEDERAAGARRDEQVRRSRVEVMEANDAAIRARQAARDREREEVEAILAYQAQKDEEMRQREVEEAERQRLMKERQQRLLDGQQRDMDKRTEMDELRARRAAEEKERRERHREQSEAEKRHLDVQLLQEERRRQAELKKAQLAREAQLEEQEYEAAVRYSSEAAARERRERDAKRAASLQHRDAILAQVQDAEARRRAERCHKFEEGRRLQQEAAGERARLEAMRDRMVHDMAEKGFNPKYLSEMRAVDIGKMYMR